MAVAASLSLAWGSIPDVNACFTARWQLIPAVPVRKGLRIRYGQLQPVALSLAMPWALTAPASAGLSLAYSELDESKLSSRLTLYYALGKLSQRMSSLTVNVEVSRP